MKLGLISSKSGWAVTLLLLVCINIYLLGRNYLFISSHIISSSMEPTVLAGDYVLSTQLVPGMRKLVRNEDGKVIEVKRHGKVNSIQRNDIIVFNYPYANNGWKMQLNSDVYYLKRCVALPGDTVFGNQIEQYKHDACFVANGIEEIYLPKSGDTIKLNKENYLKYWRCIDYETDANIEFCDSLFIVNGYPVEYYVFNKSYYYVLGDNSCNSQDSRSWGILPEDFILGKALFIWNSVDTLSGKIRMDRLFKTLID